MVRVEELFDAARDGNYDRARSLVSAFGDRAKDVVNQPDRYQRTPLHWAALNGHFMICKLLIDNGANVNFGVSTFRTDQGLTKLQVIGWTPIHGAASAGNIDVVRILLGSDKELVFNGELISILRPDKKRACVHVQDVDGWTPLHCAARFGHEQLCMFLVAAAVESCITCQRVAKEETDYRKIKDKGGMTAFDVAKKSGNNIPSINPRAK